MNLDLDSVSTNRCNTSVFLPYPDISARWNSSIIHYPFFLCFSSAASRLNPCSSPNGRSSENSARSANPCENQEPRVTFSSPGKDILSLIVLGANLSLHLPGSKKKMSSHLGFGPFHPQPSSFGVCAEFAAREGFLVEMIPPLPDLACG